MKGRLFIHLSSFYSNIFITIIMPSPHIKTIRDLIFYQYAKIIASSVGLNSPKRREYYSFVTNRVNKLRTGEINMSAITRELKKQIITIEKACEYCGAKEQLSWDHLIPISKGGLDIADNLVLACGSCNSSKGNRGLYAWYGIDKKDSLPRIVAGKYLKLLYDIHLQRGTLDATDLNCDGVLDVRDLEVY
jgi:5-methylcytosine-specific restriction endonuclease McrA